MSFHASRVCDNVSFPGDMPIGSPVSTRCLCWRKQKLEALEGRSHMLIGQRQKGPGSAGSQPWGLCGVLLVY